uniref:FMN-dependent NADH-azoreductase n=1 Tax=Globisporangium ultimum (strain ATCC 200006 / CBS 805.95 / DAOM BR144) TaxID=431595 RepID=K3X8W3_GLOUD
MSVDQVNSSDKQTVLHINASITPDSVTTRVATAMVNHLTHHYHRHLLNGGVEKPVKNPEDVLNIEELDVWSSKLPKFDRETMQRVWRARNDSPDEADVAAFKPIQELAAQLVRADFLIVTCPVWNFSIPYVLKQYIDCIMQPGLTFRNADAEGPSRPFFKGRPVIIISSSGGKTPPPNEDFVYPFISKIFAMCGFDDPHHVAIEGLANHDKQVCFDNAVREANAIADQVVRNHKLRLDANNED